MGDLITICIPTYRRPFLLLRCVQSCLIQDYRPLEIDISDNSPTDDTRDLVNSLLLPEGITVRYTRNSPSIGPTENQKRLFASARGRRFVHMNDDDVLLPGAVSALSEAFALAPDVIVSYGLEQLINADGEVLPELTELSNAEFERLPEHTGLRRDLLVCAFWQQMSHVGFMVLTEAARKVGVRDRAEVGLATDTDFAIRLGQQYRGHAHVFVNRMTTQSRVSESSLSHTASDVAWKIYDSVAAIDGLAPDEARARDRLLKRAGPVALSEHCFAGRRRAAWRIIMSRNHSPGLVGLAYSLGLMLPGVAALRHIVSRPGADGHLPTGAARRLISARRWRIREWRQGAVSKP
jgi:hypothetical protein